MPLFGAIEPIRELYEAVGPEMPTDLKSTPVPTTLPESPTVLHYNYDEGHAGRFSVPHTTGGSIAADWVMARADRKKYIMQFLAFRPIGSPAGYMGSDPFVMFIPGLNTPHEPVPTTRCTVERIQHAANILCIPMAQIHIGTSFDQGDAPIRCRRAPLLRFLLERIPEQVRPVPDPDEEDTFLIKADQLDTIQVALSMFNVIDTPIKKSVTALLATTEVDDAPPFVVVAYSRGSVETAAALKKYVSEAPGQRDEIEKRLRDRVTIVTVGSASHDYPDGPAYVHLSAWNDPLAKSLGVSARHNSDKGGKDCVFLNCDAPYNKDAFDNHNFDAITSQFLAVVMAKSGATGLRDLWEKARSGKMVVPDEIERVVCAMIVLTKGTDWLWNKEEAWKDVADGVLPSLPDAVKLLTEKVGVDFVDRVARNFEPTK